MFHHIKLNKIVKPYVKNTSLYISDNILAYGDLLYIDSYLKNIKLFDLTVNKYDDPILVYNISNSILWNKGIEHGEARANFLISNYLNKYINYNTTILSAKVIIPTEDNYKTLYVVTVDNVV